MPIKSCIICLKDVFHPLPDVITIDKTGENFRLIYDVKGRFTVHRITKEEASVSRSAGAVRWAARSRSVIRGRVENVVTISLLSMFSHDNSEATRTK